VIDYGGALPPAFGQVPGTRGFRCPESDSGFRGSTYALCLRVASAPAGIFLRAGDAVHLTTAQDMRAPEIRTSDRHMLAAAHFGLVGRSV
jgi:hypothetical protein